MIVMRMLLLSLLLAVGVPFDAPGLALAADNSPKIVYVLVDLSESARREGAREHYQQKFKEIVDALKDGDRIALAAIHDQSLTKGTYRVNEKIPVFSSLTDNRLVHLGKVKQQKERIRQTAAKVMEEKGSKYTEVMSSLVPAQQFFASYPEYQRKVLVIMSDMLEDSQAYNFSKRAPDQKECSAIIAAEKKSGKVPNLSAVKVYVIGAAAKSSTEAMKIKAFWVGYFKECGAHLDPNNYGADLARFEE